MELRLDDAADRAPRDAAPASGIEPRPTSRADRLDRIRRQVLAGVYDSPRIAEEVARRLLDRDAL